MTVQVLLIIMLIQIFIILQSLAFLVASQSSVHPHVVHLGSMLGA